MLIANVILRHHEEWVSPAEFVVDEPKATFSVQNIIMEGMKYSVGAGEWFSPSIAVKAARDAMETCSRQNKEGLNFQIKIFGDGFTQDDPIKRPTLVILPVKLGVDSIDGSYHEILMEMISEECSMGIIGGNKSASYYLIGIDLGKDGKIRVKYLDPHELRRHGDENYKVDKIHTMSMSAMNPSIAIAFYCRNEKDFKEVYNKYSDIFATADLREDGKTYTCVEDEDDFCLILEGDGGEASPP